jgi:hypothetical protein
MAEKLLLVCDICGAPATETVTLKTSSGNRQKDYCATHLQELLSGSRIPKRGRKPTGAASATRSGTPVRRKKATARRSKATSARAGYSKNGKRLGRPPGSGKKKTAARRKPTARTAAAKT